MSNTIERVNIIGAEELTVSNNKSYSKDKQIEVENIASNKVLKKIGLKFINEFKYDNIPCNWYELNKEDYGKKMS